MNGHSWSQGAGAVKILVAASPRQPAEVESLHPRRTTPGAGPAWMTDFLASESTVYTGVDPVNLELKAGSQPVSHGVRSLILSV